MGKDMRYSWTNDRTTQARQINWLPSKFIPPIRYRVQIKGDMGILNYLIDFSLIINSHTLAKDDRFETVRWKFSCVDWEAVGFANTFAIA